MTIGFIGLGRMGSRMAANIAKSGMPLVVYNRTPAKAREFAERSGAEIVASPREVAERADIIVTMLAHEEAMAAIYTGDDGVAAGLTGGKVCIDMSTLGGKGVDRLWGFIEPTGAELLDAPVSGSTASAEAASLMIMVGGPAEVLDRCRSVLETMGDPVMHVGGRGTGAALKLAINSIIFGINQSVAESLVLAERSGIDRSIAYEAFTKSAVAAPVVIYRRPVFEHPGEIPVTFTIDLAIKDLELIAELAERTGTPMPQSRENLQVMLDSAAAGMAERDMGDVAVYLREHSGG